MSIQRPAWDVGNTVIDLWLIAFRQCFSLNQKLTVSARLGACFCPQILELKAQAIIIGFLDGCLDLNPCPHALTH